MNQNNKETKPKKKFNFWWLLLICLSIIALIALITTIRYYVTLDRSPVRDLNFYNTILKKANESDSDNSYLYNVLHNPYQNYIKSTFITDDENFARQNGLISKLAPWRGSVKYIFRINVSSATASDILGELRNSYFNAFKFIDPETGNRIEGQLNTVEYPRDSLSSTIIKSISTIWPLILLIIMGYLFYTFITKSGSKEFLNNNSLAQRIKTDKKFSDIAGNEEVKEEVMELVDYLKNPKKYASAGARIPKGILLGGPPGIGKTLLAKATAGEANVPFYFISASNFVEMFVGLGAKRVRDMFEEARNNAPAIIFIDELDAVGRSRGAGIGGGNDEREQTLNQLLVEMDGVKENSGILIMAATNRADVLDPALLRPGRFDRVINVSLPDIKEREAILKLHAKGKRIADNVKFNLVARRTPGFSGAQLENVINEASLLSVRERTGVITIEQIDEAIDRVIAGPARKSRTISEKENIAVAYHEAGHAVVGIKIKGGNKVQKITIIPRGHAGGYNLMLPEEEKFNRSKSELIAMITSFMGGRVAEAIIYGKDNVSTGASDDIAKATKIARKMVTEWGLSSLGPIKYEEDSDQPFLGRDYMKASSFSSQTAQEIDLEVRKIILEAEKNAHKIISENRELLELIKDALILNETIVAEEIEYIDKNMKLPPKLTAEKQELSKDYPKADFDTLFNEVSGKKIISEDKYKKELDKKIKDLDKETKKSNNKNSSSKEDKEKPKDQDNKEK